ncbi:TPA: type 1 fimbrial protein, partial [Escherichia coli]|nr:type 1 fimbrial protein [Escherichia coli]
MSLRMWIAAGSMMLMWGSQTYANGALSDTLEKSSIINFSVNVKAPVCRISVPDSVDFGEHDVNGIRNNIEKKFAIRLESCNQQIPHPKIIFGGEYIDVSKNYIKNKAGI